MIDQKLLQSQVISGSMSRKISIIDANAVNSAGELQTKEAYAGFDIRFKSYEHRWECVVGHCNSWYNVNSFIIDLATGQAVLLRAVETSVAIQDERTPIGSDPHQYPEFYRHYDNVSEFYTGCGKKEGHDPDYWGVAKCYFQNGLIVSWMWHSHA